MMIVRGLSIYLLLILFVASCSSISNSKFIFNHKDYNNNWLNLTAQSSLEEKIKLGKDFILNKSVGPNHYYLFVIFQKPLKNFNCVVYYISGDDYSSIYLYIYDKNSEVIDNICLSGGIIDWEKLDDVDEAAIIEENVIFKSIKYRNGENSKFFYEISEDGKIKKIN